MTFLENCYWSGATECSPITILYSTNRLAIFAYYSNGHDPNKWMAILQYAQWPDALSCMIQRNRIEINIIYSKTLSMHNGHKRRTQERPCSRGMRICIHTTGTRKWWIRIICCGVCAWLIAHAYVIEFTRQEWNDEACVDQHFDCSIRIFICSRSTNSSTKDEIITEIWNNVHLNGAHSPCALIAYELFLVAQFGLCWCFFLFRSSPYSGQQHQFTSKWDRAYVKTRINERWCDNFCFLNLRICGLGISWKHRTGVRAS